MKISILGYTSAENEDKRSIKITRIGELHSTTCECTTKRCKIFYLQIFDIGSSPLDYCHQTISALLTKVENQESAEKAKVLPVQYKLLANHTSVKQTCPKCPNMSKHVQTLAYDWFEAKLTRRVSNTQGSWTLSVANTEQYRPWSWRLLYY